MKGERSDEQEFVYLRPLRAGAAVERYPLVEVTIEGTVVCLSRAGESYAECDEEAAG